MSESSVEHRDSTKGSSSSGVSSDLSDSDHEIDDHGKVFDFHIEASTQTQATVENSDKSQQLETFQPQLARLETRFKPSMEQQVGYGEELDDLRVRKLCVFI